MLESFRRDVLHALRSLLRTPAFTITAVLILALGIGMASAMFTVFDAVLVKKLPVQDQDRIVELAGLSKGAAREVPITIEQLGRFRTQTRTLRDVAGFAHWRIAEGGVSDGDRTFVLRESYVTGNFFRVLGVTPALGRLFEPADERDGTATAVVVVISYDTWQHAFSGDSGVLGRRLENPALGWSMTIVGVAPPGLDYPRGAQYWTATNRQSMNVVARLAPGQTAEAARNDYFAFVDEDPSYIKFLGMPTIGAQVHTLEEMVVGDAKPALVALSAAVALLLLLASVNIGNLLLLRAAGRVREMAIRRAIGAGAGDLVRQLLTESVLLAVGGGILGVTLAQVLLKQLLRLVPAELPRADMIGLAGLPLAVAGLVTVLAVLLFGLVPSLGTLRFDLSSPLHSDTRSGPEGRKLRQVRQALVASQVALALIVLAGAGLLGRSFARLAGLNLGYSTDHVSVLELSMPWRPWIARCRPKALLLTVADSAKWGKCVDDIMLAFNDRVMAHLRMTPEIVSVSPVAVPPFLGSNVFMTKIVAEGQSESEAGTNPWVGFDIVGPDYFRTLDVPILKGRGFTDADREGAPRVGIVTEGVARRLWPNQDIIGKRFHSPGQAAPDALVTIVGLIPDLHFREHREATPTMLRPYRQFVPNNGVVIVRMRSTLSATMPGIRHAVNDADPGAVLMKARTMDELIAPQLSRPRINALLLSIFACAAMILAAIGLYGIMASAVSQQTRELGVRMALGATPDRLRRMVLGQALTVAGIGAAAGLIGALAGSRLLTSMLFEVSSTDPITLIGVSILLLSVAMLAAYLPARRVTKIDPAQVLKGE